jgi:hypothetical protein
LPSALADGLKKHQIVFGFSQRAKMVIRLKPKLWLYLSSVS